MRIIFPAFLIDKPAIRQYGIADYAARVPAIQEKVNRMPVKDISGQRFHRLTVIGPTGERRGGCVLWRCRCDCGREISAVSTRLKSGAVKSCGCLRAEAAAKGSAAAQRTAGPKTILTGRTFSSLTVESYAGHGRWLCRCVCGKQVEASGYSLTRGEVTSCGCGRFGRPGQSNGGTRIPLLRRAMSGRLRVDNTSGATGVYHYTNSKGEDYWTAQIKIRGQVKHLGTFYDFAQAVAARKEAEESLFLPIIQSAES